MRTFPEEIYELLIGNPYLHIEAETRWPPFLQTTFSYECSWMKTFEFQVKFHWICSLGFNWQIMDCRRTGDKPLSRPIMVKFTDAYMHHSRPRWVLIYWPPRGCGSTCDATSVIPEHLTICHAHCYEFPFVNKCIWNWIWFNVSIAGRDFPSIVKHADFLI